jgi:hypothetical protein
MTIEATTQMTMTTCIQIQKRGMVADPIDDDRGLAPPDPRRYMAGSRWSARRRCL